MGSVSSVALWLSSASVELSAAVWVGEKVANPPCGICDANMAPNNRKPMVDGAAAQVEATPRPTRVVSEVDQRLRAPLAAAQAAGLVALALGAGAALQHACDAGWLGLDGVRLGPVGGAVDALFAPAESAGGDAASMRSWRLLPLAALDLALLWDAAPRWAPESAYASMDGALSGQLVTLVTCAFSVLPAVLGGWLLCLPAVWTPLTALLAALLSALAIKSALFWNSALPLLPKARAAPSCARAALRRSLVLLAHLPAFCVAARASAGNLADMAASGPVVLLGAAAEEARGMSESGSAGLLAAQLAIAVLGIQVVIEHGAC